MKVRDYFDLNPSGNANKYTDYINYIDTSSVNNGSLSSVAFLEKDFPSRAQRLVKPGDILYSSVRPNLRHYYLYYDNYEHAVASTGFVLLRNKSNYNTRFAYYYISTNEIIKHLSNIAELSQSTFPSFSPKDLGKIDLPDINRKNQDKIVSILSAYDNLIEINNKRIKVLEQMAENLYKEWFVRFRFPGYETAEFENGIPNAWAYRRFSEIYDCVRGVSYSTEEIECDEGHNLINLKNIQGYGGFRRDGTKKYSGQYKSEQVVKQKDLVMGVTDMTQDRRTVGAVALIPKTKGVISADLVKLTSSISNVFSYCMFRWGFYSSYISQFGNGANVIHLKPSTIKNIKLLVPTEHLIALFDNKVGKIIDQIDLIYEQNDLLIQQRDLLLPRLMSGKLDVNANNTKVIQNKRVLSFDEFKSELGFAARASDVSEADLKAMYNAYLDDDATDRD